MNMEGELSFIPTKHVYVYMYVYYVLFSLLGSFHTYFGLLWQLFLYACLSPFYRWRNWDWNKMNKLLRITRLGSGRDFVKSVSTSWVYVPFSRPKNVDVNWKDTHKEIKLWVLWKAGPDKQKVIPLKHLTFSFIWSTRVFSSSYLFALLYSDLSYLIPITMGSLEQLT